MSVHSGPDISNDGLVFAYDMSNTQKSWRGKPTTNYILSLDNPTLEYARGEFGQYFNFASIFETYGLVPYSLSFEAKANIPGNVVVYMQNGSYTKYSFVSQNITVSTEWQRFKLENLTPAGPTAGWQANTPADNRAMLATYTVYGSGRNPILKNIQLELGSFSTPFTASTRSNTQSVLDLTNNNTVTATSLTYASNNTFSFNGTNNFCTISDTSTLSFESQQFTFDYWVYFNNTTSLNGIIGKGEGSWEYSIYANGTNGLIFYSWPISGAGPVYSPPHTTTFVAGQWYHHCWTANGTNSYLYINGALVSTNNKSAFSLGNGTSRVTIGAAGDAGGLRYLNGSLSNLKIYNRFLSATEIQQSFNATRGRYGI